MHRLWAKQQSYAFYVDLLEVKGPSSAANPELALPTIACQGEHSSLSLHSSCGVAALLSLKWFLVSGSCSRAEQSNAFAVFVATLVKEDKDCRPAAHCPKTLPSTVA